MKYPIIIAPIAACKANSKLSISPLGGSHGDVIPPSSASSSNPINCLNTPSDASSVPPKYSPYSPLEAGYIMRGITHNTTTPNNIKICFVSNLFTPYRWSYF